MGLSEMGWEMDGDFWVEGARKVSALVIRAVKFCARGWNSKQPGS